MENKMEELKALYYVFMVVIPIATAVRVIYCIVLSSTGDENGQYKQRAKNAVVFCIVALVLYSFMGLFLGYFGKSFIF